MHETVVLYSGRNSARVLLTALVATALASVSVSAAFAQPAPGVSARESSLVSTPTKPPKLEGRENAALAYERLRDMISREITTDLQERYSSLEASDVPDEASRKLLMEHQDYIGKIIEATKITDCDWGIQYQDGFGALLPYLGELRRYARMLSFDARRCIAEKDLKGAAERYAAIYRMSVQSSRGGCLICSLVGEAIQALVCGQVQTLLDSGKLDVETARVILTAARNNVGEDTHNYLGALKLEEFMAVDWAKGHYTGPEAGAQLLADIAGVDSEEDPAWNVIRKMDGETLSCEVEKGRGFYTGVREAWGAADADERLKALSEGVAAGKFGRVTVLIGAFDRCHRTMVKGKETLAQTIKNLELFVRGEYVPGAVGVKDGASTK